MAEQTRDKWQNARRAAENEYSRALETYNDDIRAARLKYVNALEVANAAYFKSTDGEAPNTP